MSVAQSESSAPCRFRGEHPTVVRPASRLPLVREERERDGAVCAATQRGLRASSRPRLARPALPPPRGEKFAAAPLLLANHWGRAGQAGRLARDSLLT